MAIGVPWRGSGPGDQQQPVQGFDTSDEAEMVVGKCIADTEGRVTHDREIEIVERLGDPYAAQATYGQHPITECISTCIQTYLAKMRRERHQDDDHDANPCRHWNASHTPREPTQNEEMQ